MILTQIAIKKVNEISTRIELARELKLSEQAIIYNIKKNKEDGVLTTATALKVIRENTGLTEEEILCDKATA